MYPPLTIAVKYLRHYLSASNGRGHGTHSPFVYHFIRDILRDKTNYPAYETVETLRRRLLNDNSIVEVKDLGAGSAQSKGTRRNVSSIARYAAKKPRPAQLLYRVAAYFKPDTILELGTSLGITTSYLALACKSGTVHTLEGSPAIAEKARENLASIGISNAVVTEGNFDDLLTAVVQRLETLDLVFFDGNHRKEPTLRYFHTALSKAHHGSIFVFDDIHWSAEMEEAWREIRSNEKVTCSIDLFWMGFVFFRSEFYQKQHFSIRY